MSGKFTSFRHLSYAELLRRANAQFDAILAELESLPRENEIENWHNETTAQALEMLREQRVTETKIAEYSDYICISHREIVLDPTPEDIQRLLDEGRIR